MTKQILNSCWPKETSQIICCFSFFPEKDRLMTKRMDKVKLQADLKKIQSYRAGLESFEVNLRNKAAELNEELESTGKTDI